jgi:hypothetical protein
MHAPASLRCRWCTLRIKQLDFVVGTASRKQQPVVRRLHAVDLVLMRNLANPARPGPAQPPPPGVSAASGQSSAVRVYLYRGVWVDVSVCMHTHTHGCIALSLSLCLLMSLSLCLSVSRQRTIFFLGLVGMIEMSPATGRLAVPPPP